MASSTCEYFRGDVVAKINEKKLPDVGIVWDNSEPSSDKMTKLLRVNWHPNQEELHLETRKVQLLDRSLLPGDAVRYLDGSKGYQLGYCRWTTIFVDVQVVGTKFVLLNVPSTDLNFVLQFKMPPMNFLTKFIHLDSKTVEKKKIDVFEHVRLLLGNFKLLVMNEDYESTNLHQWRKIIAATLKSSSSNQDSTPEEVRSLWKKTLGQCMPAKKMPASGKTFLVKVIGTRTLANVVWQNGVLEENIPSTSLFPVKYYIFPPDFFPGDLVVEKKVSGHNVYGVVKAVNHHTCTVAVTWIITNHDGGKLQLQLLSTQILSAYELEKHPDFNYKLEACVIHLNQNSKKGGQVIEKCITGETVIRWLNGETSVCNPQELLWLPDNTLDPAFYVDLKIPLKPKVAGAEGANIDKKQEDDEIHAPSSDVDEENRPSPGFFTINEFVPIKHKYKRSIFHPNQCCAFVRTLRKEMAILNSSLCDGIVVKSFAYRRDLFSVMIKGPKSTPYEDWLFFIDFRLPADYPKSPPHCPYLPELYNSGLDGKWKEKFTKEWDRDESNLLKVIVAFQDLLRVREPYFIEPFCAKLKGTPLGEENSRKYNATILLRLLETMTKLIENPPKEFQKEISDHFDTQGPKLIQRLEGWLAVSEYINRQAMHGPDEQQREEENVPQEQGPLPKFPLMPAPEGFCDSLRKSLEDFKKALAPNL